MTYHIGFTGTRRGMSAAQQRKVEMIIGAAYAANTLPGEGIVGHHGDCEGADREFHDLFRKVASEMGPRVTSIVIYPADHALRAFCKGDEVREPKPPLARNRDIVDGVSVINMHWNDDEYEMPPNRGIMIAAPWEDVPQVRGGTWATIRMARRALRDKRLYDLHVVGRNGMFMNHEGWK